MTPLVWQSWNRRNVRSDLAEVNSTELFKVVLFNELFNEIVINMQVSKQK